MAAVSCVMGNNGSPLAPGWDWAARSLELVTPTPLIQSISRGFHVPTPTVADAENLKKPRDPDKNADLDMQETHETMSTRKFTKNPPFSTRAILGDNP